MCTESPLAGGICCRSASTVAPIFSPNPVDPGTLLAVFQSDVPFICCRSIDVAVIVSVNESRSRVAFITMADLSAMVALQSIFVTVSVPFNAPVTAREADA